MNNLKFSNKKNFRYWLIKSINFLIMIKYSISKFLKKRKTNRIMSGNYTNNEVNNSALPNKVKTLMIKHKINK